MQVYQWHLYLRALKLILMLSMSLAVVEADGTKATPVNANPPTVIVQRTPVATTPLQICNAEIKQQTNEEIIELCFSTQYEKTSDDSTAQDSSPDDQVAPPQCVASKSRTCCTNPLNGCMDSSTLEGAISAGDESLGTVQAVLDQMGGSPAQYAKARGMAEICFGIAAITGAASALSTTAKTNCTSAIRNCHSGCDTDITNLCEKVKKEYTNWHTQCRKCANDCNPDCVNKCSNVVHCTPQPAAGSTYFKCPSCPDSNNCPQTKYKKDCTAFNDNKLEALQETIIKIRANLSTKCQCNEYAKELPKMENNIKESAKSADQAGQCANGLLDDPSAPCPSGLPRVAGICPPSPEPPPDEPPPDTTPDDPCPGVEKINGLCPPPERECGTDEIRNMFGMCVPKPDKEKECPPGQLKDENNNCVDAETEETATNSKKVSLPGRSSNGESWAGSESQDGSPLLNSGGGFSMGGGGLATDEEKEEEEETEYQSQGSGGGGFGGYKAGGGGGFFGGGANRQVASLKNTKGKAVVKRSDSSHGSGKYDSIFERISRRFKKLCMTKMQCK